MQLSKEWKRMGKEREWERKREELKISFHITEIQNLYSPTIFPIPAEFISSHFFILLCARCMAYRKFRNDLE